MFALGDHSIVTPACVYLAEDGTLTAAENQRWTVHAPERTARAFKRRLGDPTPVFLGGVSHSAAELMSVLLRRVLTRVTRAEARRPDRVVLTHPANWGPFRRGLFEEVPLLAELPDALTTTEPEAAGVYYAATHALNDGDIIAVYDLGGGTLDVTVLRKKTGRIEILGTPEGIERLGGIDFDDALLHHVNQSSGWMLDELDPRAPGVALALAQLRQDCVLAKETLSTERVATVPVFLPGRNFEVTITRAQFEDLVRGQLDSSVQALSRALDSAQISPNELTAVLLVGGSSRIPLVAEMISTKLGISPIVDTHPKYAVALGAATFAGTVDGLEPVPTGRHEPAMPQPARPEGQAGEVVVRRPVGAAAPAKPQPARASLGHGEMFGPYRIVRLLARGDASEVFEAYHVEQDRVVVLKLLLDRLGDDEEFRRRFVRESRLTARLNSPHIVPIHNWGEIDGRLYLDMRFLDGEDLRARLDRGGPLAPGEAVAVVSQLARALDAAHRAGLVHRDVKPSNVLLTHQEPGGELFTYLLDFAIARPLSGQHPTALTAMVHAGVAGGSLGYAAPERFLERPVDARTDVYALGCLLHECLTGEPPFPVEGIGPCMNAHLNSPAPRPSIRRPGLPAELDEVVATALAKLPEQRYATAGALAAAARTALAAPAPSAAPRPAGPEPPAGPDPAPRAERWSWPGLHRRQS
jgi:tRNA A-37 threonylcarbamoyl transferase component Bud32/actin-like ATPase involved in cell morphogenesis